MIAIQMNPRTKLALIYVPFVKSPASNTKVRRTCSKGCNVKCFKCEKYMEGELPPSTITNINGQSRTVTHHLVLCPECAAPKSVPLAGATVCEYCGSTEHHLNENGWVVPNRKVV